MDSNFSFITRSQNLSEIESTIFDLVIVGGGINGAGIARDAAARGLSVALLEMQDFAEGTSSRSSKLIHGGIRYLENLEFGLVFEALTERRNLFRLAPHLVHPLRFVMPVYEGFPHSMNKLSLGMWLYDLLALFDVPEMHERLTAVESIEHVPILSAKELLGSFVYSDAYTDDDRLVLETLRDAISRGAHCFNHMKVQNISKQNQYYSLEATDSLSGEKFQVQSKNIISTVGPWTDIFSKEIAKLDREPMLRPTKGVHLVLERGRLPIEDAVVMTDPLQHRIVFAIPRHDFVIIGTTDTDFHGDPSDVKATKEDIDYLLMMSDRYFPHAAITEKDIVSVYAGVRPLVKDGSSTVGKTSREHSIWTDPSGIIFVAGGKYTTYRLISQQAVNHLVAQLPIQDQARLQRSPINDPINPMATLDYINAQDAQESRLAIEFGISKVVMRELSERYAGETEGFLRSYYDIREHEDTMTRIFMAEARFAIHQTSCLTIKDFMMRRVPLYLAQKDHGVRYLTEIAEVFVNEMGLKVKEVESQVDQYLKEIEKLKVN